MRLEGKKVISLVHHDFEDLELWYPIHRLREEGAVVHLAGDEAGKEYMGKYGVPAQSDFSYSEIKANDYDAILVPGGWAPVKIRRFPEVISLLQEMNTSEKVIGQICHAEEGGQSPTVLTQQGTDPCHS
ncbi:putative intracellular protease/amidase [Neobacillus cucumis]|nr:putative intracellular protease/amidase [Neobacillus cucumis]